MNESLGGAYDWSSFWEGDNCTWSGSAACAPDNGSGAHNASGALNASDAAPRDPLLAAATSVLLALLILATIVGNVFVIAAILLERHLQTVGNYLVASLAVADLMVACLVMPLGAVYEISQGWILGPELCDMWTASDVLCCTASILHLVAIATDRYWAVTNVDYARSRTQRRIVVMIVLVWTAALVVSLAPQLGWKDPAYMDRITRQRRCLVSQDLSYQIFATCSTFYVPLAVILALYWRIYQAARSRIRRRREMPKPAVAPSAPPRSARDRRFIKKRFLNLRKCKQREKATAALLLTEGQSTTTVDEISTTAFTVCERVPPATAAPAVAEAPASPATPAATNAASPPAPPVLPPAASPAPPPAPALPRDKKESLEAKRERKAAKTLAIITGAFVFCWLPFFIMALVMPLCPSCSIDDSLTSFFLWLGYFNSALNPVIYTIFSPDFRRAFTRILLGAHRRRRPTKAF